jgi:hypothetical protein
LQQGCLKAAKDAFRRPFAPKTGDMNKKTADALHQPYKIASESLKSRVKTVFYGIRAAITRNKASHLIALIF